MRYLATAQFNEIIDIIKLKQEALKQYFQEKYFPADFILEIEKLNHFSKNKIHEIISDLTPSFNSFKGVFGLASEISKRDKCDIGAVFSDPAVSEIFANSKLSRKDKLSRMKVVLEKLRFPEKFKLIDESSNLAEKIRKSFSVRLSLPDELEGDVVGISFNIRSAEELESKITELQNLSMSGDLTKIFDLILGRN